jgi:hypothetical protein
LSPSTNAAKPWTVSKRRSWTSSRRVCEENGQIAVLRVVEAGARQDRHEAQPGPYDDAELAEPGADDDPIEAAGPNRTLLAKFVPVVQRQDEGHDEQGVVDPEPAEAVADTEGGLAHQAPDPLLLHCVDDVLGARGKDLVGVEPPLVAESADDRVLISNRPLEGLRIENVADCDVKRLVADREPSRVSYKRGNVVAAFESLFDELPACAS